MNEYIFAEFLFSHDDLTQGQILLKELGNDFLPIKNDHDYMNDFTWIRGSIKSEAAAIIKIKGGFLAEHMIVSYIPESLKDSYRYRDK